MSEENKGGRPGRQAFEPTPEQRAEVERLVLAGKLKRDIASAIGISLPTLRKAFAAELNAQRSVDLFAAASMPEAVAERSPRPATGGRPPYTPNDWDRRRIVAMLGGGAAIHAAATVVGISEPTLRKHYAAEIDAAADLLQAKRLDWLGSEAARGNVAAIKALGEEMARSAQAKAVEEDRQPSVAPIGKKEAAKQAAQQVTGIFAPRPPPTMQ